MFNDPEHLGIVIGAILSTVTALFAFYALVWRQIVKPIQKTVTTLATAFDTTGATPAPFVQSVQTTVQDANAKQEASILGKFDQYVQGQNSLIRVFEETNKFKETILLNLQKEFTDFKAQAQTDRAALQTQIDAQCALMDNQNKKIDALQTSLTEKDTEIDQKNKLISELTIKVKRIDELEARVQRLEQEVKALTMDKAELERQLAAAQAELGAERVRADKLSADLQVANAKLEIALRELETEKALHAAHELAPKPDEVSA